MLGVKSIHSYLLLAGAVIAFASQAEGILNCQSTYSIEAAYKSCLHKEGIDLKVIDHSSASLEDALVSEHADTFCSYPKESYTGAMECIGEITRQCVPATYRFLLPMPQHWGEMASRVCDHIEDLDLQCAAEQTQVSKTCGQRKAHEYLQERGKPSMDALKCWTFEAEFECVVETYRSCDCMTAKVYSDIVLDIMMPSSCGQKEALEHQRLVCHDHHLPTTTTPLPALPDHVTADCLSVSSLKNSVIKCFTNEEIHDANLYNSYRNSVSPPNSIIETLLVRYGDSACSSHKLRYYEAFKCTLQLLRDCTPASYQEYLPDPSTARPYIDLLCEHRKDIDLLCASKKVSNLQACAKRKAMNYVSHGGSTTNGLLCFAFKAEFECIQESMKSCGCNTAKVYSDMSLDQHYPKTCPRNELERQRLTCHMPSTTRPTVDMKDSEVEVHYQVDSPQCMESRKQEIRRCYTNRGYDYRENSQTNSHIFYGSILDTIMSRNDLCTLGQQRAKAAVRCEAEIIHYCIPAESKIIFPDPEKLVEVLDSLCARKDEIDSVCAYEQLGKISQCLKSHISGQYIYYDVPRNLRKTCSNTRLLGDCVKDTLLTCGCPTAQAYSDVMFDVVMPSQCRSSAVAPSHMKCDATNPYTYTHHKKGGNGASTLSCTVWSLAIALCLAKLIFRFL